MRWSSASFALVLSLTIGAGISGARFHRAWHVENVPHGMGPGPSSVALSTALPAAQLPEEDPQKPVAERFLQILEKNPRRGTALDRTYGYYVESGKLEELVGRYAKRTADDPKDATAWMILGLIEAKRGRDAAAITALREAETHAPDNPLASYYLGHSLMLAGQSDQAAEALERAIARKPRRAELLEIFQTLGRLHQRAHRHREAIAVWNRLEKLFPDDLNVQEQIAAALVEQEQYEEALERFETLAGKTTEDLYRQVVCRIEAADIKLRLGRSNDALADFEALLSRLKPDSWLHRQVRQRIEAAFEREEDTAGLADYYERWIERHPEDVDAMTRLARTLAVQGRSAEAGTWFDRAIRLAPKQTELRLALIDQLVYERKYPEAIEQYAELDKIDRNNPDNVRQWGLLILRDKSRGPSERRRRAAEVWKRLIEARADDAVTAAQVADLLRQAEMTQQAIALYKKAIELRPEEPQYREYLGQYYHELDRSEDALAAWRGIAAGDRRNGQNLIRLAEVLAGFGHLEAAIEAAGEACRLDGEDFNTNLRYADLLAKGQRYEDSLGQLQVVARLATSVEQREAVLDRQIQNYQGAAQLHEQIDLLHGELRAGNDVSAERWRRLARYFEAARAMPEATAAVKEAVALDDRSIPAWRLAARIFESSGNLVEAAAANRTLGSIDRPYRTTYLADVARLEARLGRADEALRAGREVIAAAPGNPEHYRSFADLCFRLGRVEDGLEALRRAVRANPADVEHLLTLADALARQFLTAEAIELYWQALSKSQDVSGKIAVVSRLTDLYLQTGRFDRLLQRLERMRHQSNRHREMTFCIAQAHFQAQDYATGRAELERLLAENDRDTQLLRQLSSLAEQEGDVEAAAKYQLRLNQVDGDPRGKSRLAQLYLTAGKLEEADAVWAELVMDEDEPHRMLDSVDSLLASARYRTALSITKRALQREPDDWEMLYREAVALVSDDRAAEAKTRFRKLLEISLPDDEKSAKARAKKTVGRATYSAAQTFAPRRGPASIIRVAAARAVRAAVGLDTYSPYSYSTGPSRRAWTPDDFGQARMAALGWLLSLARRENQEEEFLAQYDQPGDGADADPRALWDSLYVHSVQNRQDKVYQLARQLAEIDGLPAQQLYLYKLRSRGQTGAGAMTYPVGGVIAYTGGVARPAEPLAPLDDKELDRMMTYYRNVKTQSPGPYDAMIVIGVIAELKRAKRAEQQQEVYRQALETVQPSMAAAAPLLSLATERGDVDGLLKLLDRLQSPGGGGYGPSAIQGLHQALLPAMQQRAAERAHADVIRLFEGYMKMARAQKQAPPWQRGRPAPYGSGPARYQIISGSAGRYSYRSISLNYPVPNEYYDQGALTLLCNVYELFKRDELLGELLAHFQQRVEETDGQEQLLALLGLSYLYWWDDNREASAESLRRALALSNDAAGLRFDLAEMQVLLGDSTSALETLDAIRALDQQTSIRRELSALRLAMATGDVPRARKAAQRLFGLQLPVQQQLQLAPQMQQLGLHDLAEAVLHRARRRSGGNVDHLLAIMTEYQRQKRTDVAVQVAHQILRRPPPLTTSSRTSRQDRSRQQALQLLAGSGQLDALIQRTQSQLKRSPNSIRLIRTLADYYQAGKKSEQARELYRRLADLNPRDANLRYQVGQMLMQAGQREAALNQYRLAMRQDPSLLTRYISQIIQTAPRINTADELAQLLSEVDVRKLPDAYRLASLVRTLVRQPSTRSLGMKLFDQIWEASPQQRTYLIATLGRDQLAGHPRMYDYFRQTVLSGRRASPSGSWAAMTATLSYSSNRSTGVRTVISRVSRLLDMAAARNKLDELLHEVRQGLEETPGWLAGKALLALIEIRRGKADSARPILEELLADRSGPIPPQAQVVIGQELEAVPLLRPLAIRLYEKGMEEGWGYPYDRYGLGTASRLVAIYEKENRKAEAREILLRYARRRTFNGLNPISAASQHLQQIMMIGEELRRLGFPWDAFRVYREAAEDSVSLQLAQRYGDRYAQLIDERLNRLVSELQPDVVLRGIAELAQTGKRSPAAGTADRPAVDLMTSVKSRNLDKAAVSSPIATALAAAVSKPELLDESKAAVERLASDHPQDFSVLVLAALAEFASGTPEDKSGAVDRLLELADHRPLEPLSFGARVNRRQRAAAAKQLDLWLVARECLKDQRLRPQGEKLARRAIEAARRQTDHAAALAMLRELGQLALERGDAAAAEQSWRQLLDVLVGRRAILDETPAPKPVRRGPFAAWLQVRASAEHDPSAAKRRALRPVSAAAFGQVVQLAAMAIRNDMPGLSLDCIREGLRAGPPVGTSAAEAMVLSGRGGYAFAAAYSTTSVVSTSSSRSRTAKTPRPTVQPALSHINRLWSEHNMPSEKVYEVLASVVFPERRPGEVFLYTEPLSSRNLRQPRSVGLLLCRRAVEAQRVDDLRRRLAARRGKPLAELSARVLEVQLGLAGKDLKLAEEGLDWLAERLKRDTLKHTSAMACHAAVGALQEDALLEKAVAVIELAAGQLKEFSVDSLVDNLRMRLIRSTLERGEIEEGIRQLHAHREMLSKSPGRRGISRAEYQQQLMDVGVVLARLGRLTDALEVLGVFADKSGDVSRSQGWSPLVRLVLLQLAAKPAGERYELLRAWMLPDEERATVRRMACFAPIQQPPLMFLKTTADASAAELPIGHGVVSFDELLIDAARQHGRLPELAAEARRAADAGLDGADTLLSLALIALGRHEPVRPRMEKLLEEVKKNTPPWRERSYSTQWSTYLLARACLANDELYDLGVQLVETLQGQTKRAFAYRFDTHLSRDLNACKVARHGGRGIDAGLDPGLALWHPVSHQSSQANRSGRVPAWWVAQQGTIAHLTGPEMDYLYFDCPLTGTFEFSVDGYYGSSAEPSVAYGGIVFEPMVVGHDAELWPVGAHDRVGRPSRFGVVDRFNPITIQVSPEVVRYLCNGQTVYEDKEPSPTSPWLALHTPSQRSTSWRGLKIVGDPRVPREVRLTHADRLEGWSTRHFGESMPKRISLVGSRSNPRKPPKPRPDDFSWSAWEGVIHGRRLPSITATVDQPVQSWLVYHRPLRSGETIRYEFLYQPGETMVHPCVGRIALLIEPQGVRLHWITDSRRQVANGLPPDNALDVEEERRGPRPLPLMAEQWNAMALSLDGESLMLQLNGVEIYRHRLDPAGDRLFGLFHYKNLSTAKVRNVVLTGDWPEALTAEQLADLTARADADSSPANRRARAALIERHLPQDEDPPKRPAP